MPAVPSALELLGTALVHRSTNITAPSANATAQVLEVVCAWPVSGQYGPGTRVLYVPLHDDKPGLLGEQFLIQATVTMLRWQPVFLLAKRSGFAALVWLPHSCSLLLRLFMELSWRLFTKTVSL